MLTHAIPDEENHDPETRDAWIFPASFAQRRLWFIDQVEPGNTLYNVPGGFRIRGRLNPALLERSFAAVIARHEILRTTFRAEEGEPMQIVAEAAEFHLPVVDLRALPAAAREAEVARIIREESERPFDLRKGPLLRAALLELAPAEQVLVLSLHHIITDSWSQEVLMRELTSAYSALTNGAALSMPELPIQYADFAAWQRDAMQGEILEKELGFWRERLSGLAPLDLPHLPARAPAHGPEGATVSFELPEPLTAALRAMAKREGVTLFMALLAGWKAFLARYTGQTDIAVGSPISDRGRTETEGLIGFFLNTLVLRTDLGGNPTAREALRRVRDTSLEAFAHQDLPFEMIVEEVQPGRQHGRNPLLRVMFVLMTGEEKTWRTPDAEIEPLCIEESKAKFDLMLHLRRHRAHDQGRARFRYGFVQSRDGPPHRRPLRDPARRHGRSTRYENQFAAPHSSRGARTHSSACGMTRPPPSRRIARCTPSSRSKPGSTPPPSPSRMAMPASPTATSTGSPTRSPRR